MLVVKGNRLCQRPCSTDYLSHVLDGAAVTISQLRHTRLLDLASQADPHLLMTAIGLGQEAAARYADATTT